MDLFAFDCPCANFRLLPERHVDSSTDDDAWFEVEHKLHNETSTYHTESAKAATGCKRARRISTTREPLPTAFISNASSVDTTTDTATTINTASSNVSNTSTSVSSPTTKKKRSDESTSSSALFSLSMSTITSSTVVDSAKAEADSSSSSSVSAVLSSSPLRVIVNAKAAAEEDGTSINGIEPASSALSSSSVLLSSPLRVRVRAKAAVEEATSIITAASSAAVAAAAAAAAAPTLSLTASTFAQAGCLSAELDSMASNDSASLSTSPQRVKVSVDDVSSTVCNQLPQQSEQQQHRPIAESSREEQLLAYRQKKMQAKGSRGTATKALAAKAPQVTSAKSKTAKAPAPPAAEEEEQVVKRSVVSITYNNKIG